MTNPTQLFEQATSADVGAVAAVTAVDAGTADNRFDSIVQAEVLNLNIGACSNFC